MTLEELKGLLEAHHITYCTWGTGEAKTLADLHGEVESGEASLIVEEGMLIRRILIVTVDVYYVSSRRAGARNPYQQFKLVEDRQVFADGRERRRNLPTSLQEKMKPDESPDGACLRALREELGICGYETRAADTEQGKKLRQNSQSFPGLTTEVQSWPYQVSIRRGDYRPEGYVEVQPGKTTYFRWVSA